MTKRIPTEAELAQWKIERKSELANSSIAELLQLFRKVIRAIARHDCEAIQDNWIREEAMAEEELVKELIIKKTSVVSIPSTTTIEEEPYTPWFGAD